MRVRNQNCPNCGAGGMSVFHKVHAIPVHSCVMLEDRTSAAEFPKGDLQLGHCSACGFISNVLFDSAVQDYSSGYEEQQAFSPRFRAFQTDLVARLVDQYDLRGKAVIEIGCGKGDFLIELCETGGNRGVGIDPACDPGRVEGRGEDRVRFIAELFSERYAQLPCDFLCCRHTLEHIYPTQEFVRLSRQVVGARRDALVFFEVPDVGRVLREQAFWDIYYEHCSYFTLGSLARVFRANRFELLELSKDYGDQYLLIIARPVEETTPPRLPEENDLDVTAQDVAAFRDQVAARVDQWRRRIQGCVDAGRRVAIWGSGSKCVAFLSAVGAADQIDAVVDISPYRQGKWLPGSGIQVMAPDALRLRRPDLVVVMNPIYHDEIQRDLRAMDIEAEVTSV